MKNTMIIVAVCALGSGVALADSVDLRYTGLAGGNNATHLRVGGTTYFAGHMVHEYTSGDRDGQRFATFCIELQEEASTSGATYEIVDLADAPAPGLPYGQSIADTISAVVANAEALGWIDAKLQGDSGQSDYLAKMGAIQAAVWEALGADVKVGHNRTNNGLEHYYGVLTNENTFDGSLRLRNLRAITAAGQQDMLYVVPLPPAAFAGLGMLGAIAGVRTIRRRK